MRVVLQRVTSASVTVEQHTIGQISHGLLVLVGIAKADTTAEADWLANKTVELRVFEDANGKMNRSLLQTGGSVLVVSQFTLLANCQKGRRPAFTDAAPPKQAQQLYEYYADALRSKGIRVEQGSFGADMKVALTNDGPVTIVIDREP